MRKTVILGLLMGVLGGLVVVPEAGAQDPELQKAMEFFSTAGIPGDQWIEGETFYPNVAPADHFNATRSGSPSWARPTTRASHSRG